MIVNPFIVFDFETGGFDSTKNACTEIALVFLDGSTLEEVGRYESYIKPYVAEYEQAALTYTGLTLEKLNNEGKDIKVVGSEVLEWIKELRKKTGTSSYTKKPILVGHNVRFDIGFLKQLAKESKQDIFGQLDLDRGYGGETIPNFFDTQYLSKLAWGNDTTHPDFKLDTCAARAGSEVVDAHKAINDVVATKNLFIYFINKMRSSSTNNGDPANQVRVRDRVHFEF